MNLLDFMLKARLVEFIFILYYLEMVRPLKDLPCDYWALALNQKFIYVNLHTMPYMCFENEVN